MKPESSSLFMIAWFDYLFGTDLRDARIALGKKLNHRGLQDDNEDAESNP
jgi:hypothetical protein